MQLIIVYFQYFFGCQQCGKFSIFRPAIEVFKGDEASVLLKEENGIIKDEANNDNASNLITECTVINEIQDGGLSKAENILTSPEKYKVLTALAF